MYPEKYQDAMLGEHVSPVTRSVLILIKFIYFVINIVFILINVYLLL